MVTGQGLGRRRRVRCGPPNLAVGRCELGGDVCAHLKSVAVPTRCVSGACREMAIRLLASERVARPASRCRRDNRLALRRTPAPATCRLVCQAVPLDGNRDLTGFVFGETTSSPTGRGSRAVQEALGRIRIPSTSVDSEGKDVRCFEFEIASIPRRVWIVNRDNKTFLDEDVPLAFFFHRGDSEGEGGSGQRWDSELLPLLRQKSDLQIGLRVTWMNWGIDGTFSRPR